jgi:peptide/nickel transport system substrate-binding protein
MRIMVIIASIFLSAAAPCGTAVIPNLIGQGSPAAVTSLNPLVGQSVANLQTTLLLFRPLVWIGQDDRMDMPRSLADSITALDGNRRIRVVLKQWRWSDGTPITADDVLFTWERIEKLGPLWAYYGQGGIPTRIESVRVIDAHTVDFLLREPTNPVWFALNGLSQFPPLPRHAWGDIGSTELWDRQTDISLAQVVDGPFRLQDFRLDRYAVFTPNPLYGGAPAHLARLVVDFTEGGNKLADLHAGAIDMAHVPTGLWDREKHRAGFTAIAVPEPFDYQGVIYNFKNDSVAFLRDARVRRALTDAADQHSMVALVYHGFSRENRMPVPVEPPTWLSPAAREGRLPVRSDKALARRELDAAGWHPGPDGIRIKDGKRLAFSVMVPSDPPERGQLIQIWQRDLRDVGIELRVRLADLQAIFAAQNGPPEAWNAVLMSNTVVGMPDGNGNFDTGGGFDGGYSDPKMDALIKASVDTPGEDAFFAYEDYAAAEQPVTILPDGGFPLLVANRLGGTPQFLNPQGFWAPEELWVRDEGCGGPTGGTRG